MLSNRFALGSGVEFLLLIRTAEQKKFVKSAELGRIQLMMFKKAKKIILICHSLSFISLRTTRMLTRFRPHFLADFSPFFSTLIDFYWLTDEIISLNTFVLLSGALLSCRKTQQRVISVWTTSHYVTG